MENERLLSDGGLDAKWCEAAKIILAHDLDFRERVEYYSQALINSVINGRIGVDELRGGVAWANALDREAVETVTSLEELGTADRIELFSRRLAHNSGRLAIKQVGATHRRLIAETRYHSDKRLQDNADKLSQMTKKLGLQEF